MKYDILNFKTTSSCNILTYVGVNFDGTVGPCTYMLKPLREYVLGNLFKENLIKIWRSSEFKNSVYEY
uniref:4Fe4S-binding SPASM domain-containing protein n=1 Tax=Ignisphaera aggregans TaxID=334771 RepID=A0A7C2V986_9CREN